MANGVYLQEPTRLARPEKDGMVGALNGPLADMELTNG